MRCKVEIPELLIETYEDFGEFTLTSDRSIFIDETLLKYADNIVEWDGEDEYALLPYYSDKEGRYCYRLVPSSWLIQHEFDRDTDDADEGLFKIDTCVNDITKLKEEIKELRECQNILRERLSEVMVFISNNYIC